MPEVSTLARVNRKKHEGLTRSPYRTQRSVGYRIVVPPAYQPDREQRILAYQRMIESGERIVYFARELEGVAS